MEWQPKHNNQKQRKNPIGRVYLVSQEINGNKTTFVQTEISSRKLLVPVELYPTHAVE